jgi:hypothetical protein
MAKIIMIIPYFGQWPEWINLYFYSCGQNKIIDFYFFTDCNIPENHAENLHFQGISFQHYCRMAGERLAINFAPKTPYKLCDLKPFYGFIHADLIKDYDFWAFGDIDLVLGDVQAFYSGELLKKYDVFSTHADRASGHFFVIRNTEKYRHLAFKIRNWQQKLTSEKHYILDESDFSTVLYPLSKIIRNIYIRILSKLFSRSVSLGIYRCIAKAVNSVFLYRRKIYFKEQYTTPYIDDREVNYSYKTERDTHIVLNTITQRELIYLHFYKFKKQWKENFYQTPDVIKDHFIITIDKNKILCSHTT